MIEDLHKRIWELSPYVQTQESYRELTELTADLIKLYDLQDRLSHDPFGPTRERKLSLPVETIYAKLKNCTCVVTGGLGCVGSMLVKELLKFDVKAIIILDTKINGQFVGSEKVVYLSCDIRQLHRVHEIFDVYRPDFVFHTAAQRDPGRAESHIAETVSTNVVGTLNVIKACEAVGTVKQMVFSSTGKASRYFTQEVYASTKKMDEFILDTYARKSDVCYSMVRFTHILDNSLMNEELKNESKTGDYLAVHSPGKYVTAQNAHEAAYLILNALVYSTPKQCSFLLVRHLEWPVESLAMALYYIKESDRAIPVVFIGNPVGYTEKFFRGQMDWSEPAELNLLTNVYERKYRRLNHEKDIIISRVCSTDESILDEVLVAIEKITGEEEMKEVLINGLRRMVRRSLKEVNPKDTIDILRWGLDPRLLEMENARVSDFGAIILLLVESLANSEYYREAEGLLYQQA